MFDWFKKTDYDNVVKFPDAKVPYVAPPPAAPDAKVFYRIGVTDNNRVSFSVGYSELTMTKLGVQQLIDQLQVFCDQLLDQSEDEEE